MNRETIEDFETDNLHEHSGSRGRMTRLLRREMGMDEEHPIEINSDGDIVRRAWRKPRLTILRDEKAEYACAG